MTDCWHKKTVLSLAGAKIQKSKQNDALDVFLAYQYDNTRSDIRYDVNQFNYEQDTFHEISASEYFGRILIKNDDVSNTQEKWAESPNCT